MHRECLELFPRHRKLAIPTCITTRASRTPWCMMGSLTSGFLWSRWWGKRFRNSRRMRHPQFCVSSKRPMPTSNYQLRAPSIHQVITSSNDDQFSSNDDTYIRRKLSMTWQKAKKTWLYQSYQTLQYLITMNYQLSFIDNALTSYGLLRQNMFHVSK